MNGFYKSIKTSFLALGLLLSYSSFAMNAGVVHSITGKAFLSYNGKIKTLKPGEAVPDFAEIITEVGGQVTFSDFYDRKFHLSGSGHVRLMKRLIDLKSGYLWVQTVSDNGESQIQTANSRVVYQFSEGVVSFDPKSSKTQVLSIKGPFEVANLLRDFDKAVVTEGHFTFVDPEYENGNPRRPTRLGYESFKKVKSVFYNVEPLEDQKGSWTHTMRNKNVATATPQVKKAANPVMKLPAAKRAPASVPKVTTASPEVPMGKFIYLKKESMPAKKPFDLDSYYQKSLKKIKSKKIRRKHKPSYTAKSGVEVNVFDPGTPARSHSGGRMPASINTRRPSSVTSSPSRVNLYGGNEFKKSLLKEYKRQMRHEKSVNQLIDDLKNYDQDYKTDY